MAPQTITVTVKYSKPGTQPPIYIAGSFSNPKWQPQEMQYTTQENEEHEFHKEFEVEPGKEYQYKFRVGAGDWWTLNENSPTVTDDLGNKNNLLSIPKVEKTTADTEESDSTAQESQAEQAEPAPTAVMDKEQTPSIEETMGTRETDDTLFADEITKDTDEGKQEPQAPIGEGIIEPHPTLAIPEKPQTEHVEEVRHTKELQEIGGTDIPAGTSAKEDVIEPTPSPIVDIKKFQELEDIDSKNVSDDQMEDDKAVAPPALVVEQPEPKEPKGEEKYTITTESDGHDGYDGHDSDHLQATNGAEAEVARNGARTPELANIAAEVADSAATLDREAPTPPISDEEAGRIGLRRMSTTPIPEVAITAAEVADSAALVDKEDEEEEPKEPKEFIRPFDIDDGDFPETPPNERVPKFSHECVSPPDHEKPCQHEQIDPYVSMRPRFEEEIDLNDPSIKMFPADRAGIMDHLRRLQERLPEDEARPDTLDLAPPSPVVGPNGQRLNLPAVSPVVLAQRSPSLDSIPEHNDEGTSLLEPPTVRLNGEDKQPTNGITVPKEDFKSVIAEEAPIPAKENDTPLLHKERDIQDLAGLVDGSQVSADAKPEETVTEGKEAVADREQPAEDDSTHRQTATKEEDAAGGQATEPLKSTKESTDNAAAEPLEPATESHELAKEHPSQTEDAQAEETTEQKDVEDSEITAPGKSTEADLTEEGTVEARPSPHEVDTEERPAKESPVKAASEDADEVTEDEGHPVPAPTTPLVIGNRQLGHDKEGIRELSSSSDGPSITLQPATPFSATDRQLGDPDEQSHEPSTKNAGSDITEPSLTQSSSTVTDTTTTHNDTAKSTAIEEENDQVQVKSRKRQASPNRSQEGPVSKNSMRSNRKDAKVQERNGLKAFLHVLFVEWIGGFFIRLCGGRRRRQ